MHDRLIHDTAHRAAVEVLNVFAPLLREEEQLDAYREVMPIVSEALVRFQEALAREQARLSPTAHDAKALGRSTTVGQEIG
jgi:hypothetical protein